MSFAASLQSKTVDQFLADNLPFDIAASIKDAPTSTEDLLTLKDKAVLKGNPEEAARLRDNIADRRLPHNGTVKLLLRDFVRTLCASAQGFNETDKLRELSDELIGREIPAAVLETLKSKVTGQGRITSC